MACVSTVSCEYLFSITPSQSVRLVKFMKLKYILVNYFKVFITVRYYLGQDVNRSKNKVLDALKSKYVTYYRYRIIK